MATQANRRQRRLDGLQEDAGHHRPGGDLPDLLEQLADPVRDRDSEQVEDEGQQDNAAHPDCDSGQAGEQGLIVPESSEPASHLANLAAEAGPQIIRSG